MGHICPVKKILDTGAFLSHPSADDMETAAAFVSRCRKAMGLGKVAFAKVVGRDRKTINRWEDGINEPCYEDIRKMEALLAAAARKKR